MSRETRSVLEQAGEGADHRPLVRVAAGLIWRQGRFLAARRPEGKAFAGFWEFPGGKREEGESMEQALCRELAEELGIACVAVTPWRTLLHTYPELRVELHFMHVTVFSGEPEARDGQLLRWVTPEEARALPFLPADVGILAEIAEP